MDHLHQLINRYPQLEPLGRDINGAFEIIAASFAGGGKLLIAGNGGSAADAEHIAGELMKSFIKKRALPASFAAALAETDPESASYLVPRLQGALPAVALTGQLALNTACINDIGGDITFAQQVYGYGDEGDVFLGISTSGNAKNIRYAAAVAKAKKIKVIALSGGGGGALGKIADLSLLVPETETYKVQELHLPVYHCLCLMLEERFFS
jgi:D-sedoheptulose 7-phosphate isomerase